ncbi:MAG: type II toxin-antitoxin system VapC family toxin [Pyrinomonadaceae bacterium]
MEPDRADDIWYVQNCLKASQAGEIEVITSMLTIAEVRRTDGAPTDKVKRLIRSVLTSNKIVTLAEMTQGIAERARDLHWDHGINLGGADAIHVATAIVTGCNEFFTLDARKKSPHTFAAEIATLGVKVIRASDTLLLPPEYKQGNILPSN